jgi:hypothetical protein
MDNAKFLYLALVIGNVSCIVKNNNAGTEMTWPLVAIWVGGRCLAVSRRYHACIPT